ncbi:MAG: phosphate ABC transporter, permease protein PstA [Desulfotalea sp.]|nr:MAG: phosphate ABC transporter, permease protein PstA [Desulfotalea sp.]
MKNPLEPTPQVCKRYRTEKAFKRLGLSAIVMSLCFVFFLFYTIIADGYSAFTQTYIQIEVSFDETFFRGANISNANFPALVKRSMGKIFPGVTGRKDTKMLSSIVSPAAAYTLQNLVETNPKLIGTTKFIWVLADDDVDMFFKGKTVTNVAESNRRLKDKQLTWLDQLVSEGKLERRFNKTFFTSGDSREPELAGILGAATGSLLTLFITLSLSFPIGVATAVYLEEFAPANHWTDIIEVNINNLAAVPSIIFGLLGLAIFINFWGLPRSTPIVGGLVLTLMTLPTIIIASRASLKSVPPSIREAALGIGASKLQTITHHVLPLALPGMLTGTIIGMAQALGETAPLLMIGMVAFIADVPGTFTDPSAVLPVQIYLWADSPERAFSEKTSAAIMILLAFLIAMNSIAVFLRKRFETKW